MSIINFPNFCMYWANDTRYSVIADITSRRYQKLREFLHVSNNLEYEKPENINDKLFKIQSVLDHVRKKCVFVEPEREHSIDEQIVPAKIKYSEICQYNPKNQKSEVLKISLAPDQVQCTTFFSTVVKGKRKK